MSFTRKQLVGEIKIEHKSFEVKDSRGRVIGSNISRATYNFVPDSSVQWGYTLEGLWFWATTHATRNREDYGAFTGQEFFKTEEEREAWIAKRLKSAEKTAIKNSKVTA